MAISIEGAKARQKAYAEYRKNIPKTKPIKIYAYDQKLNKKRIVQLDELLFLINVGDFNDENSTFYYRTAYERDNDPEKHSEKNVDIYI